METESFLGYVALGVAALAPILLMMTDWFGVAFPNVSRSWLMVICILLIGISYPFTTHLTQTDAIAHQSSMRRALQRFLVPWFGLLELLYALYVPMILFTLAAAAFTF